MYVPALDWVIEPHIWLEAPTIALLLRTILLTLAMFVSSLVFTAEVVLSGMILIAIALTTVLMVLGPPAGEEDTEADSHTSAGNL